jgi:pyridoxamine 5'-phosphate oxidase
MSYHDRMKWHVEHLPEPLPAEPLAVALEWLQDATRRALQPNPNAMVLATATVAGAPSARVVLCKEIRPDPGYLTFYTNYESRKGCELEANPRAAVVMHWDALHRQLRIEGRIERASAAESDAYFASRNWKSRLGAWASAQSQPVASRAELIKSLARSAMMFVVPAPSDDESQTDPGMSIPRPPHWGGYHLWAESVELWVEGSARIHDRARWTRTLSPRAQISIAGGFDAGPWTVTRLQP